MHFPSILVLLFSCKSDMQKTMAKFRNGSPAVVYYYPNKADTSHFVVKYYFQNGRIEKEATLQKGKFVGKKITYFPNGKIYQVDSLSMPCDTNAYACDGTLVRYNENGTLSQRFVIAHGAFNGLSKHYDNNGILVKEYELLNDSIKDGSYKEFYKNGKPYFTTTFKNNIPAGFPCIFDSNGDSLEFFNFDKGVLHFPYKRWLENGQILVGS